jgi:alpha-ketoglutarate-dependent taurine dioxygenase
MTASSIEVRPITGALGAEVHGVDLSAELHDRTVAEIRQALLDHCVIFFRDQRFDASQHKALARRFGDIFIHPNYKGTGPDPEIVDIRREPDDRRIVGEEWHTDTTMMPEPPMGAILYAVEVPPSGGDTLFAQRSQGGRPASRAQRLPGHQGSRGRGLAGDGERASGRAHAPGNRTPVPLRQTTRTRSAPTA